MRRTSLALLTFAAAIIGGAVWWTRPPTDPIYEGKRLSARLLTLRNTFPDAIELSSADLRALGRPGMEWLIYAVEHGKHMETSLRSSIFMGSPEWLRNWLPGGWEYSGTAYVEDERPYAAEALEMLGADAAPAIPALMRMIRPQGGRSFSFGAEPYMNALQAMGPASWPIIEQILAQGQLDGQRLVIETMPHRLRVDGDPASATEANRVADTLLRTLHDPRAEIRVATLVALRRCNILPPPERERIIQSLMAQFADPVYSVWIEVLATFVAFQPEAEKSIPHLIELLGDPNANVRTLSAMALGKLGGSAKDGVPRLQAMVTDGEPMCRAAARDALVALEKVPDQ